VIEGQRQQNWLSSALCRNDYRVDGPVSEASTICLIADFEEILLRQLTETTVIRAE